MKRKNSKREKPNMPQNNIRSVDIFGMLSETPEEPAEKTSAQTIRQELLANTKCKDLYPEGTITINKYTCVGVQCKLCVKACPTNALYWSNGEIKVIEDLCVYCGACVLNCMVDDCIKVERKRKDGSVESFSKPKDVIAIANQINAQKRSERVKSIFPVAESYCTKCCRPNYYMDFNTQTKKQKS